VIEWALKNPDAFTVLMICAIAALVIVGVAFAVAWAHRGRRIE
jgi:hypothetical protein